MVNFTYIIILILINFSITQFLDRFSYKKCKMKGCKNIVCKEYKHCIWSEYNRLKTKKANKD
ncbi:MAG: hypothetical protein ACLU8F_02960 [Clostridia bacterium]